MTHAYVHKSAVCKENNDLPVACWIPCTPVGAEACMLRACYMQILPARKASNQIDPRYVARQDRPGSFT